MQIFLTKTSERNTIPLIPLEYNGLTEDRGWTQWPDTTETPRKHIHQECRASLLCPQQWQKDTLRPSLSVFLINKYIITVCKGNQILQTISDQWRKEWRKFFQNKFSSRSWAQFFQIWSSSNFSVYLLFTRATMTTFVNSRFWTISITKFTEKWNFLLYAVILAFQLHHEIHH